jgi:hypothetical protein
MRIIQYNHGKIPVRYFFFFIVAQTGWKCVGDVRRILAQFIDNGARSQEAGTGKLFKPRRTVDPTRCGPEARAPRGSVRVWDEQRPLMFVGLAPSGERLLPPDAGQRPALPGEACGFGTSSGP